MAEWSWGMHVRPKTGQPVGGDLALVLPLPTGVFLAVVDVLGHGPEAFPAARKAEEHLRGHAETDVVACIAGLHEALRGTRGAAAGLAFVEQETGRVGYSGVGNTVARLFGGRERRLVSRDGTLGQHLTLFRQEWAAVGPRETLVLHTDGVRSHFQLAEYPQLLSDDPETAARNIVERFGKAHDDAAVVVLRCGP